MRAAGHIMCTRYARCMEDNGSNGIKIQITNDTTTCNKGAVDLSKNLSSGNGAKYVDIGMYK